MHINPKSVKFTKNELIGHLVNTINDVMKRDDNIVCNIKCYAEKISAGSNIQLKKYKSIDGTDYMMFDINIIGSKEQKYKLSSGKKKGPIIVDYNYISIITDSLAESILNIQEICIESNSNMSLSFSIDTGEIANVVEGKITDINNISNTIYSSIENNNSRYIEIEFTLDLPRKSYLMYIYIIRDAHLDLTFYFLNVIDSIEIKIISVKEDLIMAIDEWTKKIFEDFNNCSSDPAVRIKYYTVSENRELI